jgi:GT2 family glycosyltransferase
VQVTAVSRVLVVLIAHDGATWLPRTLDALAVQTHEHLEVLAVDNGSTDGSRELLLDRLGHGSVLIADRDLGFGAAVSMALDAYHGDATLLWLLHDDLAAAPDALEELVAALDEDPRLAMVGPKLKNWDEPDLLQSVGWTIDLTGRADSGVDPGELDQGQWDRQRRVLYVSTAGMLVRRDVFERLGRFDRRYHVFRDDLDLCWRAWLAGYEVEVVPAAVGEHVAAASTYVRLGQTRFIGPRYFAERNTLATLIKNYTAGRLPVVLLLYIVVGLAKVVGFVLTRRISDAWQTVRAWLWNIVHLRETLRLRGRSVAVRQRSDRELRELFGRITPRIRAYAEAIADWIAGGDHPVAPAEPLRTGQEPTAVEPSLTRVVRRVKQRPVLIASVILAVLIGVGAWPLLLGGELRGGHLAPWPDSPAAFLTDYTAGWSQAAAFGTSADPSPAQAVLGLLHVVVGGSSLLAPRVLLFGSVIVAWLLALRAAQVYSRRRLPRVVAASAYILSPPALAALATGQIGALVVLAVFPGIVAASITLSRRRTPPARAWRSVSAVALLTALAAAFEPVVLVMVTAIGTVMIFGALVSNPGSSWQRALAVRVVSATVGAWVLLLPWSLTLLEPDGPLRGARGDIVGGELWRWLMLSPDLLGFPGILAGVGFVLAGILGLVVSLPRAPGLIIALWLAALAGAVAAWWLGRTGAVTWPGLPLIVTAAAFAGLFAAAFASAQASLSRFTFGWRQIAAGTTAVAVALSLSVVAIDLVRGPWDAYAVDDPALPAFLTVAAEQDRPFRVLVLAEVEEEVRWEVVPGSGETMAAFGVPASPALDEVDRRVIDMLDRADPQALARLGVLGVRYVLVPSGATGERLAASLRRQVGIEPRPLSDGQLYRVGQDLPPVAVVSADDVAHLRERGVLPEDAAPQELRRNDQGVWIGRARQDGSVVIADAQDPGWVASAAGRSLPRAAGEPTVLDGVASDTTVQVEHDGRQARRLAVTGQVLALLVVISLALRPPGFARRRDDDADDDTAERLPTGLWGSEVTR